MNAAHLHFFNVFHAHLRVPAAAGAAGYFQPYSVLHGGRTCRDEADMLHSLAAIFRTTVTIPSIYRGGNDGCKGSFLLLCSQHEIRQRPVQGSQRNPWHFIADSQISSFQATCKRSKRCSDSLLNEKMSSGTSKNKIGCILKHYKQSMQLISLSVWQTQKPSPESHRERFNLQHLAKAASLHHAAKCLKCVT